MASLLRLKADSLYKLLPLFTCRNKKSINPNAFHHFKYETHMHASVIQRTFSSQISATKTEDSGLKYYNFDRTIFKMDMELKRIGRILRVDVDDLFKQIKRTNNINSTQSLMLLRCCGDVLVENSKSERMELLQSVLNYLKEKKFVFDVSHYNALLKVYLDNKHTFKPEDIIADMETNNVEPNRVTYQRLINYFCQSGDTDGASKVLEIMKNKSLPVNEDIFSSLIVGHFRSNDLDGVAQVLDIMKASSLELNETTYNTLLSCYAERGDFENIKKLFTEVAEKKMKLTDSEILKIVETLVVHGHKQFIPEVLTKLSKTNGFNQDVLNSIIRLVNNNELDISYELLLSMTKPSIHNNEIPNSGNFFVRQLVLSNQDLDKIIYFCNKMEDENINMFALNRATETAITAEKTELQFGLLWAMKEKNKPIRPHYFWPLIIHQRKINNKKGILEILGSILEMCGKPDADTFVDYVFPAFEISELEDVMLDIKEVGYSLSYIASPLMAYLINEKEFEKAVDIFQRYRVNYAPSLIIPALSRQCNNIANIDNIVQLLSYVLPNVERSLEHSHLDYAGQFVLDAFFQSDQNPSKLYSVLTAMIKQKISLSSSAVGIIQRRLKETASEEIMSLIEQLTLNPKQVPSFSGDDELPPHPRLMTVEDLESHLIELKSKNMNTRGVLRRLFIEHCRQQNVERVFEIKKELDDDGFQYSSGMLALLMDLTVKQGQLEEALKMKKEIETNFPDFSLDDFKVVNIAIAMVNADKYDDAVKLLTSHREKCGASKNQIPIDRNINLLLNSILEKNAENIPEMLNIILENNYSNPTNTLFGVLIKRWLLKDDVASACAEFEDCVKKYKVTPMKNELLRKLVDVEDMERLQNVINLCTSIYGQLNTLHDLAFVLLEANRIKQAKKVFETPGMRAYNEKLSKQCTWWLKINKVDLVENLINITKDVFDIDRNALYFHLLQSYRKTDDPQKALAIWTMMQEENVQPTAKFLNYLADILKDHNIPVPFSVPFINEIGLEMSPEVELKKLIKEEKYTEAWDLAEKLEADNYTISLSTASSLIEHLTQHDQLIKACNMIEKLLKRGLYPHIPVLQQLLSKLSLSGDFNTLKMLQKKLPEKIFSTIRIDTHIDFALINSDKEEEVLEKWENQEVPQNFRQGSVFHLLNKKPETLPRVEKVVEKLLSNNIHFASNILWQYYMIKEQFDKAKDIIKKVPELAIKLRVASVCAKAKNDNNEFLLTKLIDMIRPLNNPRNLAFAYSYLIGLHCLNQKYDNALQTLNELQKDNLNLEDLLQGSLLHLRKGLEDMGQPVPFEMPKRKNNMREEVESDSD